MEEVIEVKRGELRSNFSRELYDRLFDNNSEEKQEMQKEFLPKILTPDERREKIVRYEEKENNYILNNHQPTLVDLINFYRHMGLVGEERTCILQTLGAIHKLCFGIESLSGSGKTFALDFLIELLPEGSVYVAQQNSDKAAMYDAEAINKAEVIIFTELQKSSSKTMIEILKDLGEGKSSKRKVTNPERTGVTEQIIEGGKGVIYTLATENWFKKDRELERRYFQLCTDISEEQTRRILQRQAQLSYLGKEKLAFISEEEITGLKAHVASCFEIGNKKYVNPFAESLIEQLPPTIKARSFVKHYLNLVDACSHFHYKRRFNDKNRIFANLEDAYIIHELYGQQAIKSSLRIPASGEDVIALFDDRVYSAEEVHKMLKRIKSPLTFPVVFDILEELTEAGYLEKENYNARDAQYRKVADINGLETEMDWQRCWEKGIGIVKENYPDILPFWLDLNVKDSSISVLNPIEGKKEVIAKSQKFSKKISGISEISEGNF